MLWKINLSMTTSGYQGEECCCYCSAGHITGIQTHKQACSNGLPIWPIIQSQWKNLFKVTPQLEQINMRIRCQIKQCGPAKDWHKVIMLWSYLIFVILTLQINNCKKIFFILNKNTIQIYKHMLGKKWSNIFWVLHADIVPFEDVKNWSLLLLDRKHLLIQYVWFTNRRFHLSF